MDCFAGKLELIKRISKCTMNGGKDWPMDIEKWDWNPGVGLYGLVCAYKKTKESKYILFLSEWIDRNIDAVKDGMTINSTAPFIMVAELYRLTGENRYLDICLAAADIILNDAPLTEYGGLEHTVTENVDRFAEQMWADTLFMACIFLAKIYKITGKIKYKNFVIEQLVVHHRMLRDKKTGLYFHGYSGITKDNMSSAHWARANAWIIFASYIIINEIGEFEGVDDIYSYIRCHAEALKKCIDKSGGFRTIIDEEDERNYIEISATAGIAAALRAWMNKGIIGREFEDVISKAEKRVILSVNENGAVLDVSCGTPVMESVEAYYRIPKASTLYGQGLTLMMLCQ